MKIMRGIGESISDAAMWLARETDAGKRDFSVDVFIATGGPIAWLAALAGCATSRSNAAPVNTGGKDQELKARAAFVRDAFRDEIAQAENEGLTVFKSCELTVDMAASRFAADSAAKVGLLKSVCGTANATGTVRHIEALVCHRDSEGVTCCSVAVAKKEDIRCE